MISINPFVSIILPVYNVEKYIGGSIQSVLNQTFTDFELLVIDDGSPDGSINIARQINDSRIRIYQKQNGGLSDARNYGLERARGKYVYFMDSDDWIEPDLLQVCVDVLENEYAEILVFGYILDYESADGNLLSSQNIIPDTELLRKSDSNIISSHLIGMLGYAWNKMYRRSLLVQNDLYFEKGISLVEDVLFNTQVFQHVNQLHFIKKGFYHYMNRPVVTLGRKYYFNSFELKIRRNLSLERFLTDWNVSNMYTLLANNLFQSMKSCLIASYSVKNGLSNKEKKELNKKMFNHERVALLMPYFQANKLSDKLFKLVAKYKLIRTLNAFMILK